MTWRICLDMAGVPGIGKRKRAVVVIRSATGQYVTAPTAPRPGDGHEEEEPVPVPVSDRRHRRRGRPRAGSGRGAPRRPPLRFERSVLESIFGFKIENLYTRMFPNLRIL